MGLGRGATASDARWLLPLREDLSHPQVWPWPLFQDSDMFFRMPAGHLYVVILRALPTGHVRSPRSFPDLTFCDSTKNVGSEKLTFPWRRMNINEEQRNHMVKRKSKKSNVFKLEQNNIYICVSHSFLTCAPALNSRRHLSLERSTHMCWRTRAHAHGGRPGVVWLGTLQGHQLLGTSYNGFLAHQSGSLAPAEAGSRNNN